MKMQEINLKRDPRDDDLLNRFLSTRQKQKLEEWRALEELKNLVPVAPVDADYYNLSGWKKLRDQKRNKQPFCEICGKPVEDIHHIIPFGRQDKSDRMTLFLDEDNLMSLCEDCHHRVHSGNLLPNEKAFIEKAKYKISSKYYKEGIFIKYV